MQNLLKKILNNFDKLHIKDMLYCSNSCISHQMKSKTLACVVQCLLVVLTWLNPAHGKGLLSNLMKQAETLSHGLDLASKVGDIGQYI